MDEQLKFDKNVVPPATDREYAMLLKTLILEEMNKVLEENRDAIVARAAARVAEARKKAGVAE